MGRTSPFLLAGLSEVESWGSTHGSDSQLGAGRWLPGHLKGRRDDVHQLVTPEARFIGPNMRVHCGNWMAVR